MNTALSTLIILLLFGQLYGQKNYLPGYIISNENDTTYGLIEYGVSRTFNHNICRFKNDEENKPNEYLPGEIKAYRFSDNRYYISKEMPVKDSVKEVVFVEILVDGIVNLYYYVEDFEGIYYIEKENGEISQLSNESKRIMKEGKEYETNSMKHVGVLLYTFSDCNELYSDINNTSLDHKSLINLSKKYHEYTCKTGEECIVYEKPKKFIWDLGVYYGYNISRFDLNKWAFGYSLSSDFKISYSSSFGLYFEFSPPFWDSKYSFVFLSDYSILYYEEKGIEKVTRNVDLLPMYYMKIEHWHNTISFKYTYPSNRVKPIFIGGINVSNQSMVDSRLNVRDPITPLMYGLEAGTGIDLKITETVRFFCIATYAYQYGTYNEQTHVRIRTGVKF